MAWYSLLTCRSRQPSPTRRFSSCPVTAALDARQQDFILADSDGYADLDHAPGLGVEIDWAALEQVRVF